MLFSLFWIPALHPSLLELCQLCHYVLVNGSSSKDPRGVSAGLGVCLYPEDVVLCPSKQNIDLGRRRNVCGEPCPRWQAQRGWKQGGQAAPSAPPPRLPEHKQLTVEKKDAGLPLWLAHRLHRRFHLPPPTEGRGAAKKHGDGLKPSCQVWPGGPGCHVSLPRTPRQGHDGREPVSGPFSDSIA